MRGEIFILKEVSGKFIDLLGVAVKGKELRVIFRISIWVFKGGSRVWGRRGEDVECC